MIPKYSPDAPEVIGYYWHRDGSTAARSINCPRQQDRNERIVKVIKDQGTNALIIFDSSTLTSRRKPSRHGATAESSQGLFNHRSKNDQGTASINVGTDREGKAC
jgi:hypothetical protein